MLLEKRTSCQSATKVDNGQFDVKESETITVKTEKPLFFTGISGALQRSKADQTSASGPKLVEPHHNPRFTPDAYVFMCVFRQDNGVARLWSVNQEPSRENIFFFSIFFFPDAQRNNSAQDGKSGEEKK